MILPRRRWRSVSASPASWRRSSDVGGDSDRDWRRRRWRLSPMVHLRLWRWCSHHDGIAIRRRAVLANVRKSPAGLRPDQGSFWNRKFLARSRDICHLAVEWAFQCTFSTLSLSFNDPTIPPRLQTLSSLNNAIA